MVIQETFFGFIPLKKCDAASISASAINLLKSLGLDTQKLRGQGYDGASVMSGVYGGVQKLIKDMVIAACQFVHCASHNMNLVIGDTASSDPKFEAFFQSITDLYTFFSRSDGRWIDLTSAKEFSGLNPTRCSGRHVITLLER